MQSGIRIHRRIASNFIFNINKSYFFISNTLTMEIDRILTPKIVNFLLLLLLVRTITNSGCPAPYLDNYIVSGKILAALNDGMIPLNQADDYTCYNYSLPYQVSRQPEVAISVHDFEIQQASNRLYFYIKPIKTDIFSYISFVIKTQWAYTSWNYISFSFLAEDRTQIQSGYYQIDSGALSSCGTSKSIIAYLPIQTQFNHKLQLKHIVFLHGFQLSTSVVQNERSPLQLQLLNSKANSTSIALNISIFSQSRVDSIYVSYVIIQNPGFRYQMGHFLYNKTISNGFWYNVSPEIGRNYARIQGLTGFIIQVQKNQKTNGNGISLKTDWDGFGFKFIWAGVDDKLMYFSFNYLFFLGSQCDFCSGYPFSSQGSCVAQCPIGTVQTNEKACINCGPDKHWNGSTCLKICPKGQYLQQTTNICRCPPTLNWTGQSCIFCTDGKEFDPQTFSCECTNGLQWNGVSCSQIPKCTMGKIWDVYTYSCKCPDQKYWNGTDCAAIPSCFGGQILNLQFQCVCKQGFYWNGFTCNYSPCLGGQLWTGSTCACPISQNYNGSMCIECINGQKWNKAKNICQCQNGYKWNSILCEKSFICVGNMIWNDNYQQCVCPAGSYWSGYRCIPIPKCLGSQYFDIISLKCTCLSNQKWDGRNCIECKNGKIWNVTTLSCSCPIGSTQSNNKCLFDQKCSGGKIWVESIRSCQCPVSSVWNGVFCIANPCDGGRIWNQHFKACACPGSHIFINGSCAPPRISCTNGKVWNPVIYACECPPGTFNNIANCDEIPICSVGKIYNPLTNKCNCPYGLVENGFKCVEAQCPEGQYYNGFQCQIISCPAPSYFSENKCVVGSISKKCEFSYFWNGQRCVFYQQRCPSGTIWSNSSCSPASSCPINSFKSASGECISLPQKCPSKLSWNSTQCASTNSSATLCPNGTFWSINKCLPYQKCKNGTIWDHIYMKCVCSPGTFSNGINCVACGAGRQWIVGVGCICPEGMFDTGAECQSVAEKKCATIPNSIWNYNKCLCRPGFSKFGFQCLCLGIQVGSLCDRCSHKPNSQFNTQTSSCQCKKGYIQIKGSCLLSGSRSLRGTDDPESCTVSTYFDRTNMLCVACPQGCLSCKNFNQCITCQPQFIFDSANDRCIEICGDGKRFFDQCDDGNNLDGDGCSRDCRVQFRYLCKGGSPENRDKCILNNPQQVSLELIGQVRYQTSIILNIRLNYIPQILLYSTECSSSCNVLTTKLVSGDKSSISTTSSYIAGSQYVFAVKIQFGKPYIGSFEADISINKIWAIRYFGRVSTQKVLRVAVNPAYLSIVSNNDRLS